MRKIYLVDDQPVLNKINKRFISMINGNITVNDFTEPKLALDSIAADNPDLVLLDLNMPEISGWDFLDQLHRAGINTNIIILTSSESQQDKAAASNYPQVKEYFVKPLGKEDLSGIISRYFQ